MTKLFIARHGQTEWNRDSKLQGWKDAPLTERGIEQARALRDRLMDEEFDAVYCSPLGRTLKTAEIVLDGKDLSFIEDERLKEIDMGQWEGIKTDDIKKKFSKQYADFWERPHKFKPIDGESFHELKERVVSFLEDVLERHKGENILIFSHGCASKVMMSYFEERSLKELWKPPKLEEGCLNIVEVEEGDVEVILFGDTSFQD
ncbi:MAG: histidine phosphatase family protein [Candidatus Thermoplasmatota archaeon]|nr:histidine phosphatase family protein [Candidatus Thermoplasmatota archaeon]